MTQTGGFGLDDFPGFDGPTSLEGFYNLDEKEELIMTINNYTTNPNDINTITSISNSDVNTADFDSLIHNSTTYIITPKPQYRSDPNFPSANDCLRLAQAYNFFGSYDEVIKAIADFTNNTGYYQFAYTARVFDTYGKPYVLYYDLEKKDICVGQVKYDDDSRVFYAELTGEDFKTKEKSKGARLAHHWKLTTDITDIYQAKLVMTYSAPQYPSIMDKQGRVWGTSKLGEGERIDAPIRKIEDLNLIKDATPLNENNN